MRNAIMPIVAFITSAAIAGFLTNTVIKYAKTKTDPPLAVSARFKKGDEVRVLYAKGITGQVVKVACTAAGCDYLVRFDDLRAIDFDEFELELKTK